MNRNNLARWCTVAVFAAAMAWVEAAVVYYLGTMVDRLEPYQADPLPLIGNLGQAELIREAATLIMLLTVGMLAGRNWRARFGYAAVAFGIWDIFYYAFLRVICGWPHSLGDWDILFLLPLPWWGPVWAPVCIALLMMLWGSLVIFLKQPARLAAAEAFAWMVNLAGSGLALYVFMADALRAAPGGADAIRATLPSEFHANLFGLALLLMAAPLVPACREWRKGLKSSRNRGVEFPGGPPAEPAPVAVEAGERG